MVNVTCSFEDFADPRSRVISNLLTFFLHSSSHKYSSPQISFGCHGRCSGVTLKHFLHSSSDMLPHHYLLAPRKSQIWSWLPTYYKLRFLATSKATSTPSSMLPASSDPLIPPKPDSPLSAKPDPPLHAYSQQSQIVRVESVSIFNQSQIQCLLPVHSKSTFSATSEAIATPSSILPAFFQHSSTILPVSPVLVATAKSVSPQTANLDPALPTST